MCHRNVLLGASVIAFGLGVLVGTWLKSGFVCHIMAIALIALGFAVLRRH